MSSSGRAAAPARMTLLNWRVFLFFSVISTCSEVVSADNLPPMGDFACGECDPSVCQPVNCTIGILVKDLGKECSCCQRCIHYLEEGDSCSSSSVDEECGPGLRCAKVDGAYSCTSLNTTCVNQQKDYDRRQQTEQVGMFEVRPDCDPYGNFKGMKRIPGLINICVDEDGSRIFGEVASTDTAYTRNMDCKCSRLYQKTKTLGYDPPGFAHCLPNGNFDRLQCYIQACRCLDDKQKPIGDPFPISAITDAPCYDSKVHKAGYMRSCESELARYEKLLSTNERQNRTVMGMKLPSCTPDGLYHPVQRNSTTAYCVTPNGLPIENFAVTLGSDKDMNCACARARFLLEDQGTPRPQCCRNGNFNPVQCRSGHCFCVNQWGEQDGLEVPDSQASDLSCGTTDC